MPETSQEESSSEYEELKHLSWRDFGELMDKSLFQLEDALERKDMAQGKSAASTLMAVFSVWMVRADALHKRIQKMVKHSALQ